MKQKRQPDMNRFAPGDGGLILPKHVQAQRRAASQDRWRTMMLFYCPEKGPQEVPSGTYIQVRPGPVTPHPPMAWLTCPHCHEEHIAALVFVKVPEEPAPAAPGGDGDGKPTPAAG